MFNVHDYIKNRLQKFHWSPALPESYVIEVRPGEFGGIGTIAKHCYGSFNLTYALHEGRFYKPYDIQAAICTFAALRKGAMLQEVDGYPLGTWATVYTEQEFLKWAMTNESKMPASLLPVLYHLQTLHHAGRTTTSSTQ